jgi:type IV secretory pathway TraG/TraD family ATPase VirD4
MPTLEDVLRILTDAKYRERVVATLDDQVLKNFWEAEFNTMQERLRTEAISPILNKVGQFVTSPLIRNVVNTNSSSFDIETVMNEGKILLVNVSQGKLGEDNMALLGAMIITKIQLAAMNRVYIKEEDRRDFYLYIDEFQNFATTSFIKILSEARKYRLNLILANQYMAQIPEEVKDAIFGNAGSMVSFIMGANDADYMQKEFGGKYTQEDLVSLGRYQTIMKLMIDGQVSHPFPANTLSLASSSNQNREKVLTVSRERYAKRN